MKSKIYVTLLSALTATALCAQDNTAPQPAPPASAPAAQPAQPETAQPAPAPKSSKKKKTAKSKSTKTTAKATDSSGSGKQVYNPPASATVKQEAVNVRGQASFIGEVITHLKKGETVTVLEEITLKKPKKDEPAKWAKILMPTNTPVWVSGDLIDSATMTASKNVSVRGGPGENYSRVAILPKGTAVKEIRKNKGWIEIETPANAAGYVAADFLDIQPASAAPVVAANTPAAQPVPAPEPTPAPAPAPAPEATAVTPQPAPVAANPNEQPTPSTPANPAEAVANTPAPAPSPTPAPEVSNEPPPKRVVTREGVVKKARNIQSPTDYELHDARTGEAIEYLMSATANKTLKPYLGMRVLVTGPEMLDARWKNTPIVEVESIELP
jgi:uncharacterized protein YgiM (DUF1202 family)